MGDGLDYFQQRKQNKHLARLNAQAVSTDSDQLTLLRALLYEAQQTNAMLAEFLRQRPQT